MSSDHESESMLPSDSQIERTLRDVVKTLPPDKITVNAARSATEEKLGLNEGFLKEEAWKARSKQIITDAVNDETSPTKPSPKKPASKPTKTARPQPKPAKKRASTERATKPNKRRKRAATESESEVSDVSFDDEEEEGPSVLSDEEEEVSPEPVKKKAAPANERRSRKVVVHDDSDEEEVEPKSKSIESSVNGAEDESVSAGRSQVKGEAKKTEVPARDDSESEMSEVLDEPVPKRRRQKSASTESKSKSKAKTTKAPSKGGKALTPDEEEIKRLQGWLVKCGIRKVWARYLAPYDTPKAKIKHLKDMLKDAGMDGRYSNEKASAIKEQRELAADLAAVQEGAKIWGQEAEEEEEDAEEHRLPKRRAAAVAARFVDFGDSDEESD